MSNEEKKEPKSFAKDTEKKQAEEQPEKKEFKPTRGILIVTDDAMSDIDILQEGELTLNDDISIVLDSRLIYPVIEKLYKDLESRRLQHAIREVLLSGTIKVGNAQVPLLDVMAKRIAIMLFETYRDAQIQDAVRKDPKGSMIVKP